VEEVNKLKKKEKPVKTEKESSFEEQQTPYAGCVDGVPVESAPHVLVSGPRAVASPCGPWSPARCSGAARG
jgi:hypothetical protein